MKKNQRIIFIIFTVCLGIDARSAFAQMQSSHTFLRQGMEKGLNMEIQDSLNSFQKSIELDNGDPRGFALQALAYLFSAEMSFEQKDKMQIHEQALRLVQESLVKAQKRLALNPRDGNACFAMATARIMKAHLSIRQRNYLTAAHDASYAWSYIEKAREADPQNFDIYLPMGFFHYHIGRLSRVTRFFSSLLITEGDPEKGIQELEVAAQKGDLLKELAKSALAAIYLNNEDQPGKALAYMQELRERYPRNYNFTFGLALNLSEVKRFEEALAVASEIEKGILSGKAPYSPQLQPRFANLMGRILFNRKEYAKASEYFREVLKIDLPYNNWNRASALLRLGMIHDVRRERKDAVKYYSQVADMKEVRGRIEREAKQYLRSPYEPPA